MKARHRSIIRLASLDPSLPVLQARKFPINACFFFQTSHSIGLTGGASMGQKKGLKWSIPALIVW